MMLIWTEPEYLLGMTVWLIMLVWVLKRLLRWRRTCKSKPKQWRLSKGLLSVWMLLAFLTLCELSFAAFADQTDAFNMTNISKRWFRRYIEPERNADGFRDRREVQKKLPTGIKRVVFLGDSFTIGHGIRHLENRFSDRVEVGLNANSPTPTPTWQVANFAECGWEIAAIEGIAKGAVQQEVDIDVFVYVYMLNDIEGYDPQTERAIKEIQKHQPQHWLWTRTYFFNWLYFRWQQLQAGRTVDYFPHLAASYRSPAWDGVSRTLIRMRDTATERGVEFRLVLFPFLHNLGPDYPFREAHQQLVDFCRLEGIPVQDLEPTLSAHRADGLVVGTFDNHPNEHCHQLVADALLKDLLSDLHSVQTKEK